MKLWSNKTATMQKREHGSTERTDIGITQGSPYSLPLTRWPEACIAATPKAGLQRRWLQAKKKDEETTAGIREGATQYPILADVSMNFRSIARSYDVEKPDAFKSYILKQLQERKEAGDKTIKTLNSEPNKIWELVPLVQLTLMDESIDITDNSGKSIWDRVTDVEQDNTIRSIGLAAIGVVLGIAGFFTGGATWAALALGAAGVVVSGIDLYFELESYDLLSNAAKATLGEELANDPGLLGVGLAILGLVTDLIDLGAAGLKLIRSSTKAIKSAKNIAVEAGKQYDILKAHKLLEETVTRDEFVRSITKALDSQLSGKALKEFTALLKSHGLTDLPTEGLAGLYKANPKLSSKLITAFSTDPKILARLNEQICFNPLLIGSYTKIDNVLGTGSLQVFKYMGKEGAEYAHDVSRGVELLSGGLGEKKICGFTESVEQQAARYCA